MAGDDFFTILDTVDSTNNYAMGAIHAGLAKHGKLWFANEQTAGKGQRGKTWTAEKGKNIAMSIVLDPGKLHFTSQFQLSALVALSCFEFFSGYAGEETKIKWPNDLYWRDRKAGGVLIENIIKGKTWKWAIVGIGLNINQTAFDVFLNKAVSLKQISGRTFNTIELAKELNTVLMKKLENDYNLEDTVRRYNEHLYRKNNTVTLKKDDYEFNTVIKEVSTEGKLITVDAIEHEFDFGEVEWVL